MFTALFPVPFALGLNVCPVAGLSYAINAGATPNIVAFKVTPSLALSGYATTVRSPEFSRFAAAASDVSAAAKLAIKQRRKLP